MQNWPAPRVKDACSPVATALPRLLQGPGKNKDRVHAAHLGVARDRLRPGSRELHQGRAAGKGAGKRHCLDCRVFHQLDAYLHAGIEEHGKHALGQAAGAHAFADCVAHQRAGARMRGMRFHDYGIACGEGRSRVSSGYGKGQGKIAGAENGDRAERVMHGADGGLGQGLAVGVSVIDARVHPGAFFHYFRKEPQLITGSPHLALQASFGQCCFQVGPLDDGRRRSFDGGGNAAQKGAFFLARKLAVNGKGGLRQARRPLQIVQRWRRKIRLQGLSQSLG